MKIEYIYRCSSCGRRYVRNGKQWARVAAQYHRYKSFHLEGKFYTMVNFLEGPYPHYP